MGAGCWVCLSDRRHMTTLCETESLWIDLEQKGTCCLVKYARSREGRSMQGRLESTDPYVTGSLAHLNMSIEQTEVISRNQRSNEC